MKNIFVILLVTVLIVSCNQDRLELTPNELKEVHDFLNYEFFDSKVRVKSNDRDIQFNPQDFEIQFYEENGVLKYQSLESRKFSYLNEDTLRVRPLIKHPENGSSKIDIYFQKKDFKDFVDLRIDIYNDGN